MKTWKDGISLFEGEIEKMGLLLIGLPELCRCVAKWPLDEATEACKIFAITHEWPPLSRQAKIEIQARLCCAVDYCRQLASYADCDRDELRDVEESLLNEYWLDVGQQEWLYKTLIEGKDPYGIGEY